MKTPAPAAGVAIVKPVLRDGFVEYTMAQRCGDVQFARATVEAGGGALTIALGYRRCWDFDAADAAGQDALTLRVSPDCVVGVVADGVSQSFYGELAAERVAKVVAEALWLGRGDAYDEARLAAALKSASAALHDKVTAFELRAGLPPLQRAALERTRRSGSQSVFAAVLFYPATAECHLVQIGDVPAIVEASGTIERILAPPEGRWSSEPRTLSLHHRRMTTVSRVLLKTDGAGHEWGETLDAEVLGSAEAFRQLSEVQAPLDDVSYVSLAFSPTPAPDAMDLRGLLAAQAKAVPSKPPDAKTTGPTPGLAQHTATPPRVPPPAPPVGSFVERLVRAVLPVGVAVSAGAMLAVAAVGVVTLLAIYAVVAGAGWLRGGPDVKAAFDCGLPSAALEPAAILTVKPRFTGIKSVVINVGGIRGWFGADGPRTVAGPVSTKGAHSFAIGDWAADGNDRVSFEVAVTDPDGDEVFRRQLQARRGQTCTLTLEGRL